MATQSKYRSDSFYANTSIRDFYLDLWDHNVNLSDSKDTKMIIPTKYHKRPDLMAYDIYKSPNYWWIFALKNKDKLIDPVEDFVAGLEIIVPFASSMRSLV